MRCRSLDIANMNLHYFRYPFRFFLEKQRELGEDQIVFWGSVPHLWVDQYGAEDAGPVFAAAAESGVKIRAFAARPYNYSLFAPEGSPQRLHTESYYRRVLELAAASGIPLVAIDLWGALRDGDQEEQYRLCRRMLGDLCARAHSLGLRLAVGNVPYASSAMMNTLPQLRRLAGDIDSPALCVALDLAQAASLQEDVREWHEAFGEALAVIYLSDLRSGGGGYPLGRGCCALQKNLDTLQKLPYRGIVALRMDRVRCEHRPWEADAVNYAYLLDER